MAAKRSAEASRAEGPPSVPPDLAVQLQRQLLASLDLSEARRMPEEQLRRDCAERLDALLERSGHPLLAEQKRELVQQVLDEIFGLGAIEGLLRDPTVNDILVNGPEQVFVEREGRLEKTSVRFRDDDHLLQVIQRIANRVGRRIDEGSPMLDARLADGSRVNAIIPPLALDGPMVSIRRFATAPLDLRKLVANGTLTSEMARFLAACARCRLNLLISGGTGSGKTTLMNALSRHIPEGERVVTIEDAAELQLQKEHVVRLETRPPNIEGEGEVTQRDLLRNALRMRPDRIIIGEVRGSETLDMLQAMNTGHEGSMSTVHANNPRDALRRVENMVTMAGVQFPVHVIREQVASALHVLVQIDRLTGGPRRVTRITEIAGVEGDVISMQDLFRFEQTGLDGNGRATGHFASEGIRPICYESLRAEGEELPSELFSRQTLEGTGAPHDGF